MPNDTPRCICSDGCGMNLSCPVHSQYAAAPTDEQDARYARAAMHHPSAPTRETPTNAQQEPGYPGADTVAMSLRYPMMTCHRPSDRCAIQEPHQTAECGEFAPVATPAGAGTPWMAEHTAKLVEQLRAFAREHLHGGCQILSLGDYCPCNLCAVDTLAARLSEAEQHIAAVGASGVSLHSDTQGYIDALERKLAEAAAAREAAEQDAARYRAIHPYFRGCVEYEEPRGWVLRIGERTIPTGVRESGWTGELIDLAADYARSLAAARSSRAPTPEPLKASGLTEREELEANVLDFEEPTREAPTDNG